MAESFHPDTIVIEYTPAGAILSAVRTFILPRSANDHSHGAYGNWPQTGTQWVQYDWTQPVSTRRVDVYWFDAGWYGTGAVPSYTVFEGDWGIMAGDWRPNPNWHNGTLKPVSDAAHAMNDSLSPLEHALSDGEDFELAFTVSPADGARLIREQPVPGIQLAHIGEMVAEGLWLEEAGERKRLEPRGWEHQLS